MDQQTERPTNVERTSDRELTVTRLFDADPQTVYEAWSRPELFRRWWVPSSAPMTLEACDMDVRAGGTYRLVFADANGNSMAFFGNYTEVEPGAKMVWTNDEGGETSVTTVTFAARGNQTLVTYHEQHPTTEALQDALSGSATGLPEQFAQLDQLLAGADA